MCYRIYLTLTEIHGSSMPDAIRTNETRYIFPQELLPLIIILSLFYMGETAVK